MKLSDQSTEQLVAYAAKGGRQLYGARLSRAGKIIRNRDGREAHAAFVDAANGEWSRLQREFEKAFFALPQSEQRNAAIAWQERGEMPKPAAPVCIAGIQGSSADRFDPVECGKPATHVTTLGNTLCKTHAKQKRYAKGNPQPIAAPAPRTQQNPEQEQQAGAEVAPVKPAAPKTFVRTRQPWGQYARTGHRVLFSDGVIRAVEMSETADTFFSVPARARIAGKWLSGYVTTEERESDGARIYSFRQHGGQEAKHSLPAWPDSYTPERDALLARAQ